MYDWYLSEILTSSELNKQKMELFGVRGEGSLPLYGVQKAQTTNGGNEQGRVETRLFREANWIWNWIGAESGVVVVVAEETSCKREHEQQQQQIKRVRVRERRDGNGIFGKSEKRAVQKVRKFIDTNTIAVFSLFDFERRRDSDNPLRLAPLGNAESSHVSIDAASSREDIRSTAPPRP